MMNITNTTATNASLQLPTIPFLPPTTTPPTPMPKLNSSSSSSNTTDDSSFTFHLDVNNPRRLVSAGGSDESRLPRGMRSGRGRSQYTTDFILYSSGRACRPVTVYTRNRFLTNNYVTVDVNESMMSFQCIHNYHYHSGDMESHCLDGHWLGEEPRCEVDPYMDKRMLAFLIIATVSFLTLPYLFCDFYVRYKHNQELYEYRNYVNYIQRTKHMGRRRQSKGSLYYSYYGAGGSRVSTYRGTRMPYRAVTADDFDGPSRLPSDGFGLEDDHDDDIFVGLRRYFNLPKTMEINDSEAPSVKIEAEIY